MDSITHIALGAVMGEAYAGKELGKRAMVIGALAQSLPDIDFLMSFWLSPVDDLLAHRGFAHSILFATVVSVLLGIVATRWGRPSSITTKKWIVFFALEISVHLMLDAFNNYGIGWFEPFNHTRISFDVIFVADPFYSIWLGIACLALLILHSRSPARRHWIRLSLIFSSLYLVYALYNKSVIERNVTSTLHHRGVSFTRLLTTPAPLNNWLWFFVAEVDSGYYAGYRSVFDNLNSVDLNYFPRNASLLNTVEDKDDVEKLLRFSQGYYTVENQHDTLVFNDLRFGQITGWSDPRGRFAFHYYLNYPEANSLVVQRGRFANWNKKTVRALIRRMAGRSPSSGVPRP
jgi:inner membrane protein